MVSYQSLVKKSRISNLAFFIHYRSNPYEHPIPQLDVQRAVRLLRHNSEKFGLDKEKISMIGFSAGGNKVGTYVNQIMGNDLFPSDYKKDDVDMEDDKVIVPAMIYPALSYNYNVPMLFAMFDDEDVRNDSKRQELLEYTDLKKHLNLETKNQFIAYGTKDSMVGMDETKAYIKFARDNKINVEEVSVEGGGHGFAFEKYGKDYIDWLDKIIK